MADQKMLAYVKDERHWDVLTYKGDTRTSCLHYKGFSVYRTDVLVDGKWKKKIFHYYNEARMREILRSNVDVAELLERVERRRYR